jgi:hypothetical protein
MPLFNLMHYFTFYIYNLYMYMLLWLNMQQTLNWNTQVSHKHHIGITLCNILLNIDPLCVLFEHFFNLIIFSLKNTCIVCLMAYSWKLFRYDFIYLCLLIMFLLPSKKTKVLFLMEAQYWSREVCMQFPYQASKT